jgi:chromatin-remodeling ATPase INO80
MIDILEDFMNLRKYTFFRLDGASNIADRRDMVNDFQKPQSKIFVFLLSTRAGIFFVI